MRLTLLFLVCLLAATCCSAHNQRRVLLKKSGASDAATRLRAIRRTLLSASEDGGEDPPPDDELLDAAPACNLAATDPTEVKPSCPPDSQAVQDPDTGVYRCLGDCSTLNRPRLGLKYQPSVDGTMCMPICPDGQVVAGRDADSVVCALCPRGTVYLPRKGACFQKCGEGATAGLPFPYDDLSPPRCSAACKGLFPIPKTFDRCRSWAGRTTLRNNTVRSTAAPRKKELAAVPRPETDLSCPEGSEAMQDEDGNTSCYACPDGEVLTEDGMGYAKCATETCSAGYNRCGIYCWHEMLSDGLNFWDEDYCSAFLDAVATCLPDCETVAVALAKKAPGARR